MRRAAAALGLLLAVLAVRPAAAAPCRELADSCRAALGLQAWARLDSLADALSACAIRPPADSGLWARAAAWRAESQWRRGGAPGPRIALARAAWDYERRRVGAGAIPADYSVLYGLCLRESAEVVRTPAALDAARAALRLGLARQAEQPALDSTRWGVALNALGSLDILLHDYAAAESSLTHAWTLREAFAGPAASSTLGSLENLAVVHGERGQYSRARAEFDRVLALRPLVTSNDSIAYARVLANDAVQLEHLGDYDRGLELADRATQLLRSMARVDTVRLIRALNAAGALRVGAGDGRAARRDLLDARALADASTRAPASLRATIRMNLARAADVLGDLATARTAADSAVALFDALDNAQFAADARAVRAGLLVESGDAPRARADADSALALYDAVYGPGGLPQAAILPTRARAAWEQGDLAGALHDALAAEAIGIRSVRETVRALPEREGLAYAEARYSGLDLALTLAAAGDLGETGRRQVWDAVVRSRGVLLDELAARHRAVVAEDDSTSRRLAAIAADAARRLATVQLESTGEPDAGEQVAAARRALAAAEESLAARSASFRALRAEHTAGLSEVLAALPQHTALVAYVRVTPVPRARATAPDRYLAFVTAARGESVLVVDLGNASTIDTLVQRWVQGVSHSGSPVPLLARRAETAARGTGTSLRRAIWDPITAHLGSSTAASSRTASCTW